MFKGEYQHSIDDKGRMIIPAKLRSALGESFVLTKGLEGCLFAFSAAEWIRLEKRLRRLSFTKQDARAFSRLFFAGAADIEPDKQFRALIPPQLREYAGLERDITVLGVGTRAEIWASDRWQAYNSRAITRYETLAETLFGFDAEDADSSLSLDSADE